MKWHLRALLFVTLALGSSVSAQDLEPRAYSNSPTGLNFVVASYAYSTGSIQTDPALPVDNLSIVTHSELLAFARSLNVFGKSAKIDVIAPFTSLAAEGLVLGVPRERHITGFSDPYVRFSMILYGAPALTMKEFARYKQDWIIGASLRIGMPLGHYENDKVINLGSNRWSFRPEIGVSKAMGSWIVEAAPGVAFYADNGDFFGGKTREQAPLFGLQTNVTYVAKNSVWLSLSASYFAGGRSTVDDVENDDEQEGGRIGATLSLPINRHQSFKLYALRGFNSDLERNLDVIGISWQYRWGGGF